MARLSVDITLNTNKRNRTRQENREIQLFPKDVKQRPRKNGYLIPEGQGRVHTILAGSVCSLSRQAHQQGWSIPLIFCKKMIPSQVFPCEVDQLTPTQPTQLELTEHEG